MAMTHNYLRMIATVFTLAATSQALAAEGGTWSVSKSTGEVWITSGEVQQVSLKPEDNLKAGDTIRTGRNGRVLLVRGEESILIAPNSVVGLPAEVKEGLSTTIVQQAGSILLEVQKRDVKHFEVETPYLAAVVKGTQFRVSVNATSTSVDVIRGQVEVADFKSGQIAQVMQGQSATAFEHGNRGLSLSGSGTFSPIEQSKPRPTSVDRIPVPKGGLSAPRNAANGRTTNAFAAHGRLRISSALGEVKVDFNKVTHGLARGSTSAKASSRNIGNNNADNNANNANNAANNAANNVANNNADNAANNVANNAANNTIWNSSPTASANAVSLTATGATNALSSASPVAATVAAITNSGSGNGNGNGNGANGNGNGGVGNGKGIGNLKH